MNEHSDTHPEDRGNPCPWVPSQRFQPWYLPDWTPEQWASWGDAKRTAMTLVVADIWHFESKKDREDYQRDGVYAKLALAEDLYIDGLER
jgi:hypothetical protein